MVMTPQREGRISGGSDERDAFEKWVEQALSGLRFEEISDPLLQGVVNQQVHLFLESAAPAPTEEELIEKIKNAKQSPAQIRNHKRVMEWLASGEGAYLVNFTISLGHENWGRMKVDLERLVEKGYQGREALTDRIARSQAETTLPVFKAMTKVKSRLEGGREKCFDDLTFIANGLRFTPESKLPELRERIQEVYYDDLLPTSQAFIRRVYDVFFREYAHRASQLVSASAIRDAIAVKVYNCRYADLSPAEQQALRPEIAAKMEEAIQYFLGRFPSLESLLSGIRVVEAPYFHIASIEDQAQKNAELAELLRRKREEDLERLRVQEDVQKERDRIAAERETERQRQNLARETELQEAKARLKEAEAQRLKAEALLNSQQQWLGSLQQEVQNTIAWANAQVLKIVEEQLDELASSLSDPEQAYNKRRQIDRHLKKASKMLLRQSSQFDELAKLIDNTGETAKLGLGSSNKQAQDERRESVMSRIEQLREQVKGEYRTMIADKQGHAATAFENLLGDW